MRIGIIGAMEEEVQELIEMMEDSNRGEAGGCIFYQGKLRGRDIVLMQSGIGKVNAAIGTALLIDRYKPMMIVNTGVAGGFDPTMDIGDLVISSNVRYNDVDATVFGYEYGQVPGMPASYHADPLYIEKILQAAQHHHINAVKGLILSGDSFMNDERRIADLREKFPVAKCAEMEAGSIAQVCARFSVPFVIIRALSDIVGKDAQLSYEQFLVDAAKQSTTLVLAFLETLEA